jgi:outer membrane protein
MNTPMRTLLIAITAPLMAFSSVATAQSNTDTSDTWRYTVGIGAMSAPKYPGAKDTEFKVVPVLGATYGRFFVGAADIGFTVPLGVGYYLVNNQNWKAGVAVGYDIYSLRKESDNRAKLQGLGDIERTVRSSLFARYTKDQYSVFGALIHSAKGQGMQAKLGANMSTKITPSLIANVGPSLTWSNQKSNQTFYGVNAQQSANSGIREYRPSAGISDVTLSAGLTYLVTPSWSIGSRVGVSYLPSKINDSPIVEEKTTTHFNIFTAYRF